MDPGGAERRSVRGRAEEVEPLVARHQGAADGRSADARALCAAATAAPEAQKDEAEREKGKLADGLKCSLALFLICSCDESAWLKI